MGFVENNYVPIAGCQNHPERRFGVCTVIIGIAWLGEAK